MPRAKLVPADKAASGLLLALALAGCRRGYASSGPPEPAATTSASALLAAAGDGGPNASADAAVDTKPGGPTLIDVVVGGDAIPQVKVLANSVAEVMKGVPSCWNTADARILNLEAPIGERKGLPGDKKILAFAAPPSWFADLYAVSKASGFVVANNHSCDLGPQGLADTVSEAGKLSAPVVGAGPDDPWKRLDVVEKDGRHVCIVAWTTFLNDKGRKQRGCLEGENGAKVARAELKNAGVGEVHEQLGAPGRWDGCDARIAYLHGGREYKPQIRPIFEQASAAAAYVDAVIVSHPHVPDLAETIVAPAPKGDAAAAGGRAVGRTVPLFRSLGNFISNQGIAWSLGMSVDLLEREGVPDPIRTVWTRVSMLARLRFGWDPDAKPGAPPSTVLYGYTLAFSDRGGNASIDIRLRPLPNGPDDPVAAKLRKAPKPFGLLIDAPCRIDEDEAPTCDGLHAKPEGNGGTDAKGSPEPAASGGKDVPEVPDE